jgi:ubiquinone/menaquinone biosynthesis C-methylase UbiE
MDHFQQIYTHEAAAYHRLIAAEDVEGNLLPALQALTTFPGQRVLDIGSGTGRIPLLLHDKAATIIALDRYPAMLREQKRQQDQVQARWSLVQGEMAQLPFGPAGFDVTIAGWVIGHLTEWAAAHWLPVAGQVVGEMERVTRPGGVLIIIETLGTGRTTPAAPTPALAEYYVWLETDQGFHQLEISTDYRFNNLPEAITLTGFFFGPEMAELVRTWEWIRVPEWTGIWWKFR